MGRFLLLGFILLAGLALRIWNNDYGLPFVYSIDEASHFTSRAVEMLRDDLDPGYYQNPAAYTYLIHGLLRVMFGPLSFLFPLHFGNVTDEFANDPTTIWTAARTLAAVLGVAGVACVYAAGRRLWGVREGLVAAAVMAFAFLPVAYSRVAVTDVGSLIGVALALLFAVLAYEKGRLRDYALAGAAAGLALSFKYTAGLALLPLGIAALARLRADGWRVVGGVTLAGAAGVVVFVVLNPYLLGSFDAWWNDLGDQAEVAANQAKPGQDSGGLAYYLDSLTWGLGWAACVAALAGAVLELRRNLVRGLMLVAVPLALIAYLSLQSRYFGRWLLPAYPALALLAAVAISQAGEALAGLVARRKAAAPAGRSARRGALLAGALTALITAVVLAQPLAADVRTALVLGREDTREQARDFLVERFPPGVRVSIEPAVPGRWYRTNPSGGLPPWLSRCPQRADWLEPGWRYPGPDGRLICTRYRPGQFSRPDGGVRASAYHLVLHPGVIDDYRFYGYCTIVTFGTVRERAIESGAPEVEAYYERLDREADVLRRFSPYDDGAKPVPFDFDLSFNYYPTAYERPGPVVTIYRLRDCDQAFGSAIVQVPGARELPPFAPRNEGVAGEEL